MSTLVLSAELLLLLFFNFNFNFFMFYSRVLYCKDVSSNSCASRPLFSTASLHLLLFFVVSIYMSYILHTNTYIMYINYIYMSSAPPRTRASSFARICFFVGSLAWPWHGAFPPPPRHAAVLLLRMPTNGMRIRYFAHIWVSFFISLAELVKAAARANQREAFVWSGEALRSGCR
jgi:hypothetical protein